MEGLDRMRDAVSLLAFPERVLVLFIMFWWIVGSHLNSLNLEVVYFASSDHFPLMFYFWSTNISKNQRKSEKLKHQTVGTETSQH